MLRTSARGYCRAFIAAPFLPAIAAALVTIAGSLWLTLSQQSLVSPNPKGPFPTRPCLAPFRCSAAWLNKPIGSHQRSQGNAHRVASRSPIFCTVLYRVPIYLRFVAIVL